MILWRVKLVFNSVSFKLKLLAVPAQNASEPPLTKSKSNINKIWKFRISVPGLLLFSFLKPNFIILLTNLLFLSILWRFFSSIKYHFFSWSPTLGMKASIYCSYHTVWKHCSVTPLEEVKCFFHVRKSILTTHPNQGIIQTWNSRRMLTLQNIKHYEPDCRTSQ